MERILRDCLPDGRFSDVEPVRSKTMKAVRGTGNRTTEQRLRYALVSAGISGWTLHRKDIDGKPDFFFEESSLAVFVDGCFWHGCPRCGHVPRKNSKFWQTKISRNRQRDWDKAKALRKAGCVVLRFWEHELKDNLSDCILRIRETLEEAAS